MVEEQVIARGIKDRRVLDAISTVPRHLFVEEALWHTAYCDSPLPIGEGQTISQPFIVALMTEALELEGTEKILEIGTGSGYQTAVLSLVGGQVFSIERIGTLASRARKILDGMQCRNVVITIGDGTLGVPEEAPFDRIIVTAASPSVPEAYVSQLSVGGVLVIPVGDEYIQELVRVRKTEKGIAHETLGGCRFVKLIGKDGWQVER